MQTDASPGPTPPPRRARGEGSRIVVSRRAGLWIRAGGDPIPLWGRSRPRATFSPGPNFLCPTRGSNPSLNGVTSCILLFPFCFTTRLLSTPPPCPRLDAPGPFRAQLLQPLTSPAHRPFPRFGPAASTRMLSRSLLPVLALAGSAYQVSASGALDLSAACQTTMVGLVSSHAPLKGPSPATPGPEHRAPGAGLQAVPCAWRRRPPPSPSGSDSG